MKFGIVGAGAMGTVFAHFIKLGGHDIFLYEKDEKKVEKLSKGIGIIVENNNIHVKFNVSANPVIVNNLDYCFFLVKSYSTASAAEEISPFINKRCTIFTVQNGIGNYEILRNIFPDNDIIYGTTSYGAAITKEGSIKFGGHGDTIIGGDRIPKVKELVEILNHCNINTSFTSEPRKSVWEKAIINAAINPLGALLKKTNGEILSDINSHELQKNIINESVKSAQSRNLDINYEDMLSLTIKICKKTSENRCSMLQDIEAGRKTEIDTITGEIIRNGEQFNLNLPVSKTIYNLIKSLEKPQ